MRFGVRRACSALTLLAATLAAGCGGMPTAPNPDNGVLTLTITPADTAVTSLQLDSAALEVENLSVLGDVAPDSRSMIAKANIDLLSAGSRFTFTMLPQGVYSRVRFNIHHVVFQGTWRGVQVQCQIEIGDDGVGGIVDLRTATGGELAPGHDVTLPVTLDVGSWFADNLLDAAVQSGGNIQIDEYNNTAIGQQLATRALSSFTLSDGSSTTTPLQ